MSLSNKSIAFIGAGNMAEALIRGLLGAPTVPPAQLVATDVRPERLEFFRTKFGIRTAGDNRQAAAGSDIIVLAVKPQKMSAVLAEIKTAVSKRQLIISIAAGVTTGRIESEVGGQPRVVRVMPNTPALVGAGAAALSGGRHVTEEDLRTAETVLGAVGITVRVDEKDLDAVTALSGSGPAYVFHVAEAMIQAGIEAGLAEEVAKKLAIQTVSGAAQLLAQSGEAPEVLRRKVTSPGGTTEAALKVMTDRQVAKIFSEAIQAAARRSRELSG